MSAIEDFAKDVVERAQRNLGATRTVGGKKRRAVSSGNLKDSLTYKITSGRTSVNITFMAKGSARTYAKVVEEGRKPNSKMPPVSAIEKWIRQKPIRLRGPQGGFVRMTDSKVKGVAFVIARKIGKDGIAPLFYFRDAYRDTLADRGDEILEMLRDDLNIRFNIG